jgi:hypothetical protein
MQHVSKRFRMHQAMLDGDIQQQRSREIAPICTPKICESLINFVAHVLNVVPNLIETGPIGRLVSREPTADRIDPKGKQPVEIRSGVGE